MLLFNNMDILVNGIKSFSCLCLLKDNGKKKKKVEKNINFKQTKKSIKNFKL